MERLKELSQEINELTLKIEQEYPELYEFLNENPITIPTSKHPQIDTENLAEYLDSLNQLLKHYLISYKTL
jgi:hypothetical protein